MTYTTYRTGKAHRALRRSHAIRAVMPPILLALAGAGMTAFVSPLALPVAMIGALDVVGRYRDYRYLSSRGYINLRLANYYGRSFCGRNVVTTLHPEWRRHYRNEGYRWYHVLPDGTPRVFLNRQFWRNLFTGHRQG